MHTTQTSCTSADIIAFPCNQFGSQENKCDVDIKEFAKKKGAQFTMMAKIDVVGCCALFFTACRAHLLACFLLSCCVANLVDRNPRMDLCVRLLHVRMRRTERKSMKCIPSSKISLVAAVRSCGISAPSSWSPGVGLCRGTTGSIPKTSSLRC